MKKIFTLFIFTIYFFTHIQAQQNFGYFASAVWLKDSSTTGFFNTYDTSDASAISNNPFLNFNDTALGTFPQNSGSLQIGGGEIKSFKDVNGGNVCGGTLFYTVYPHGNRPASPVYTAVDLGFFSNCTNGVFDVGGGPCSEGDQKWQTVSPLTDLTNLSPGTYTLEVYYREQGSNSSTSECSDTVYDNNNNAPANYTASFIITQALPVTLLNFNASYHEFYVLLNWSVANEVNEKGFQIERSTDAVKFSTVSFIPSKGNYAGKLVYSFTDKNLPTANNVFYRLKMVNDDGKANYSSMLPVSLGSAMTQFTTQLFSNKLIIHFSSLPGKNSVLQLSDMQGRVILKHNLSILQNQSSTITIPLTTAITNNIYIIALYDGGKGVVLSNKVAVTK